MKKTSTKKVLICLSILFLLWTFIVSAVSIDPWKFVATMRIQQINLYYRIAARDNSEYEKDDIVKAWMTNYLWINKWSLYIRPVDYTGNLVDETNNVVTNPDYASIIWWQMNINDGDETTLILWWSKNTVGWHWVVLMWWDGNTATVNNAVVLWSASSTVGSANWVVMAANGWNVYWNNSTMFWGGWLISTWADNSFAIGWGVTIIHQWVFSYGSTSSVKPNIAQFNGWKWIMVWWRKPNGNSNIQLSVNWALAVWRGICDTNMRWSIYYKPGKKRNGEPAYCLCACVDNNWQGKAIALSNQPYCNSLCECQSENPDDCVMWLPECWTRWFSGVAMNYAAWEKGWRVASKFCADNRSPIEYWVYQWDSESATQYKKCDYSSSECDPPFPWLGQRVVWSCPSVWHYSEADKVKCSAYRNIDPPELAECWENVRRYKYAETWFQSTVESGFCKRLNSNPTDYAHNGKVTAYKKLTRTQVEHGIKSGFKFEYITWDISGLLGNFPWIWERTYWKCETTNAMWEIEWQETVNEKECYADHLYCNHCAKDGFPYCFDVKFDEDCDCKDPELCPVPCVPSTDKAWDYYIYLSWNDTDASDDLHSNHTNTSIKSNNWVLEASIDWQKVVYHLKEKNGDSTARTLTATITTDDHSFCSTWIVTIYQCAKWQYWDEELAKCAPAKCLGKVPPGAVPWNDNILLEPAEIFLTWTVSGLAKDCAYKCAWENEPYTDSKWQYHSEAHDALHLIRAWDSLFCAMCEEGTYDPELMMCVINDPAYCFKPYEWFWYDEFHSEGQCVLPGKCDDAAYENANESREDLTPPAGITSEDVLQWYCVSDSAIAKQHLHECVYTCKAWTICDPVAQQCVTPSCDAYPYSFKWQELIDYLDKGEAWYDAYTDVYNPDRGRILQDYAAYSNFYKPISNTNLNNRYRDLNPELKKEYTNVTYYINGNVNWLVKRENNPTLLNQKWFFVQASSTGDFESKINGLDWCFAWCTWSTYRLDELDDEGNKYRQFSCWYKPPTINPGIGWWWDWDGDGDGSSCNYKDLCSGELPGWKSYWYTFQYWCDDEYGDGYPLDWSQVADENAANNQPCKYWCLPEYQITEKGWKKYCYKKCKEWEYAAGYLCLPCPEWSSPNEDDKDAFWQPKSCWRQCSDTEYAWSNGNCYKCSRGQKWDPASKDSHWNATKCVNICPSDETFWTVEEGKSDCWRDENNQIRRNCCLRRFALGNTRCDLNPKPDECNRVGQICVCATNLTSV